MWTQWASSCIPQVSSVSSMCRPLSTDWVSRAGSTGHPKTIGWSYKHLAATGKFPREYM